MKTTLKLALLASSALFVTPVLAQTQPTPPEQYTLNAQGVDLVSGGFTSVAVDAAVGSGAGALSFSRVSLLGGWRDVMAGTIGISGNTYTVSLSGVSRVFTKFGSTFTPQIADGSTFTQPAANKGIYTSADGTVVEFAIVAGQNMSSFFNFSGYVEKITEPAGKITNYSWGKSYYCLYWDWECYGFVPVWRIEKIENNFGYGISFEYASNDALEEYGPYLRRTRTVAYNAAVERCDASNNFCRSSNNNWTSSDYIYTAASVDPSSVTDQSGRTTHYTYSGANLASIRLPGSTSAEVSVSYASGKVSSVTDASGTWSYAYSDVGATRTTTATGPLSQFMTVVANLTIGRATSVSQLVSSTPTISRTTGYEYDSQRRLTKVTQPEGDYVQLTYDARGNVTQTRFVAKPSSGLADIVTSAVYPATCANPITCNRPTSTTDARANTTNYTYDSVHGGVLTVTAPAPTGGAARPQTRTTYAAQTAWFKNNAGVLAPAPSSVMLPIATSQCITGSSCAGSANEVKSSIVYGVSGLANNLLPTSVSTGAGDGSLTATTMMTYTVNGDVATKDGPLAGGADTTSYVYDTARQLIGVIGPDPDGSGPLLRRAQRFTYSPGSQVISAELGTTTGTTAPAWAAFATLMTTATAYDGFGRVTHQRLQSGSTTHSLIQTSYDAAGRTECATTRMNPSTFASPPVSACAPATAGGQGPDRITKYGFNPASELTSTTSGYAVDAITEGATYSLNGRPISLTDGRGNISIIKYDGFDRLVQRLFPNPTGGGTSATDFEQYGYDPNGNVVSYRSRGAQTFTSTYDALNRSTAVAGGGLPNRSITYDNLGRVTSASIPGHTTTFTYDVLSRTMAETGPMGTMSYQYDLAGRRIRQTWPDAFYVTTDWNLASEVTSIRHGGAAQIVGFGYNNLGLRTSIVRGNGVGSTYAYDSAGRLSSLAHNPAGTADDVTFTYTYNPAGQILTRLMSNTAYAPTIGSGTITYANNGRNQVTSVGGTSVSYDASGNITNDATKSFAYDGANRATSAGAATMSYDAIGRLYQLSGGNGGRYLYDGSEAAGLAPVGSNVLQDRFIRGPWPDEVLVNYTGTGPTPAQYWLADERGSSINIVDGATGATVRINTYDEYGIPGSTNLGRFQYTGQLWVPDAGVYHYKTRLYSPRLGRFLQTDPIGYAAGSNLYGYVSADPINRTDPTGLQETPTVGDVNVFACRSGSVCEDGQLAEMLQAFLNNLINNLTGLTPTNSPSSDATVVDSVVVNAFRTRKLGSYNVRFNLDYEQVFLYYPNGEIVRVEVRRWICTQRGGGEYEQYRPAQQYPNGFSAIIHVHQTAGNFPFPGPRDAVTPYQAGIPNYGLSNLGAWVIRPGNPLGVDLLDGSWGSGFDPVAYADLINRNRGETSPSASQDTCRRA